MAESIEAEAEALNYAGRAFNDVVDDVNAASTNAQNLDFDGSRAGKGYHAQGTAYQTSMQKMISTLLSPMAAKVSWVGVTLESTASHYTKQESTADAGIKKSGRGA